MDQATEEKPEEALETPHYFRVKGTENGQPFWRVYALRSPEDGYHLANLFLFAEQDVPLSSADIEEIIAPLKAKLIIHQVGVPPEQEAEKNPFTLLMRTLIQYRNEYETGGSAIGKETLSNLPTFYAIWTKGGIGYAAATIFGLGIIGVISYRAYKQWLNLKRALEIFVEHEKNMKERPIEAIKLLSERIKKEGLLFQGIGKHDTRLFKAREYRQLAIDFGILPKLSRLDEENIEITSALNSTFKVLSELRRAWGKSADYISEQLADAAKNIFDPEIHTNIIKGFKTVPSLFASFNLVARSAPSVAIGSYINLQAEEERADIRIKEHTIIQINDAEQKRQELKGYVFNERLVGAAFLAETGFMAAHVYEAGEALHEGVQGETDWTQFALSVYSILQAWGAWGFLGREAAQIRDTLKSTQAQMLKLYDAAEGPYHKTGPA